MNTIIISPLDAKGTAVAGMIILAFAFYGLRAFIIDMKPKTLVGDLKRWYAARTQQDDRYD